MSDKRLTASCHCGSVAFDIPEESVGVICCHCEDCRKMHGNYNAMLGTLIEDVHFTKSETLHWYNSSDKARRAFCTNCGSRIFKENLGSGKYMVSAGIINGATGKHIIRNIFEQSKGDWYEIPPASA